MAQLLTIEGKTADAQSNALCVDLLRRLLAKAEAGEVIGLAVVSIDKDRNVDTEAPDSAYWRDIFYGLAILQKEMIDEDDVVPGDDHG